MWNIHIYYPAKFREHRIQITNLGVCRNSKMLTLKNPLKTYKHGPPSAGLAPGQRNQLQVLEDTVGVRGPQHQPPAPAAV